MWNQHTYDVGTWTKDKMERERLTDQVLWSSIVSRTPKQNSYPTTIKLSQTSSISSLSDNNYSQKRQKKDKVNEFIEKMGKRSINNVPKQQINHTKLKLSKPQHNDQSSSHSTSKKSLPKISNTNSPKKQNTT